MAGYLGYLKPCSTFHLLIEQGAIQLTGLAATRFFLPSIIDILRELFKYPTLAPLAALAAGPFSSATLLAKRLLAIESCWCERTPRERST